MRSASMILIATTHLINIAVLLAVLSQFVTDAPGMVEAYGADGPARRILASIYGAILLGSTAALAVLAVAGSSQRWLVFSASLFAIQLIYKLATIFTVGLGNPVVIANTVICIPLALSIGWVVLRSA
ncbi:MAG: hypothetical protein AAF141_04360 [Pseudomonadota bacterium]